MSEAGLTETPFRKVRSDMLTLTPCWERPTAGDFKRVDGIVGIICSPIQAISLPGRKVQEIAGGTIK
jgi:hypothetical protein